MKINLLHIHTPIQFISVLFLLLGCMILLDSESSAQTIRYQQSVRGGLATVSNCLVNVSAAYAGAQEAGTAINTAGGTTMSSYGDLVLPTGSSVVKAFLYIEAKAANKITSVRFRVPGGAYTTLTTASPGFIQNSTTAEDQFAIDVSNLMPANGYVSTVVAGGETTGAGRYAVADPTGYTAAIGTSNNLGWGWTLYVIYTNPGSAYRNITIADVNSTLGCTNLTLSFNITGVSVPSAGAFNAIAAFSGCAGAIAVNDEFLFGKTGTTLVDLNDPTINTSTAGAPKYDMFNSTIGICAKNNVSVDAAAIGTPIAMSGNVTSRNPYNTFTCPGPTVPGGRSTNWYSYFYDSDMMDASGILPNSATPLSVTVKQNSPDGDCLSGGSYAVSIDIKSAIITKSLSPTTIISGGVATYSWKMTNFIPGGIVLTGIGFTDNLPASIVVAPTPNATITGNGTGGTIIATPGASSVVLSGLTIGIGDSAVVSVDVTNKTGTLNGSCATNPAAFTNGFTNLSGVTDNLANNVTNQCLIVTAPLPVNLLYFVANPDNNNEVALRWASASEQNSSYYTIEHSVDGVSFTQIEDNIKAAGNSSTTNYYSLEDAHPAFGINYYRLKQFDMDGMQHELKTVSVEIAKALTNIVIIPQPADNSAQVTFTAISSGSIQAVIYDITGRVVLQIPAMQVIKGANSFPVNLSSLEKGVYFISISSNDGFSEDIKLLKN